MMKHLAIVVIILLVMLTLVVKEASATYDVHPSIDVSDFIMYTVEQGNLSTKQIVPTVFRIQWYGEYDKIVKSWWNPFDDPSSYKYEVVSKEYIFEVDPPQVIEYGNMRILLSYFVSISAIPYASKTWYGEMLEHIKVIVSVYVYGTVDKPPSSPMRVDLSSLMRTNSIFLDFTVVVRRTSPSSATYIFMDSFSLLLSDLTLKFYELYPQYVEINTDGAVPIGNFSSDGYIGIVPKGSIRTTLCLKGPSGYELKGKVYYTTKYGTYGSDIELSSNPRGGCSSTTIYNAVIIPGEYTGNNKFTLTFKSGAITLNIVSNAIVKGSMGVASIPFIVIVPERRGWNATMYIGIDYASYRENTPFYVGASGTIYIESRDGRKFSMPLNCNSIPITSKTTYICNADLGYINLDPSLATKAYADVTVTVSMYGLVHSDTISVNCALITPSNVYGIISMIYNALLRGSFIVIAALILLYLINSFGRMMGRSILDPYYILQGLMNATVLTAIIFIVPYFHALLLNIIYAIPEFYDVLKSTPLSNPNIILGMIPDQAMSMMMSYYDMTFNTLKIDYKIWFESEIFMHILVRLIASGIIVGILVVVGIALAITHNSAIVSAFLGPFLGYISTIVSMMMMIMPLAGVVNALIAIAEFIVSVAAVVFLTIFLIGLFASTIPVPLATRIAEDFIGGTLLYILSIPALAPIIYATYIHVRNSLAFYINQVEEGLPGLHIGFLNADINIIIPIVPLMKMIGYVTLASLVLLMIIVTHAYILSRTGVMVGLGETILKVSRR